MRCIRLAVLLFLLPSAVFGQSKADYDHVMSRFVNFFNHDQSDSLCMMYRENKNRKADDHNCMWNPDQLKSFLNYYGELKSFKYMGTEPGDHVTLIKIEFNKTVDGRSGYAIGMTLDKQNNIDIFRFFTTSPYIDSLLRKF